jgi:hypothetical protein
MNLKFITLIVFVFTIGIILTGCNPGQDFKPTSTPPPTITAALIPTQTNTPTPESTATHEATATTEVFPATPPVLEGNISGFTALPDVKYDSAGFHITLPDSGRILDISSSKIEQSIVYSDISKFFTIYDDQGKISAEYVPSNGADGDPYYTQEGWVDLKDLSNKLVCTKGDGKTCINEQKDTEDPNSVWFESISTGVFMYSKATNINGTLGALLGLQVLSRDKNGDPITDWIMIQSHNNLNSTIKYNVITDYFNVSNTAMQTIEFWEKITPKGMKFTFSLLKKGTSFWNYISSTNDTSFPVVADFISSGGAMNLLNKNDASSVGNIVLVPNGIGD